MIESIRQRDQALAALNAGAGDAVFVVRVPGFAPPSPSPHLPTVNRVE